MITTRGKIVLAIVVLAFASLFTYTTRDVCWTGTGYGSCATFVDNQLYENRTPNGEEK